MSDEVCELVGSVDDLQDGQYVNSFLLVFVAFCTQILLIAACGWQLILYIFHIDAHFFVAEVYLYPTKYTLQCVKLEDNYYEYT